MKRIVNTGERRCDGERSIEACKDEESNSGMHLGRLDSTFWVGDRLFCFCKGVTSSFFKKEWLVLRRVLRSVISKIEGGTAVRKVAKIGSTAVFV